MKQSAGSSYHHGDLKGTLMVAAEHHIGTSGTEKLSLRALAREAGVSATAPYRHFPTKRCLLAALATVGFRELHANMEAAQARLPAEERLIAIGVAYVEYALANPVKYQLMFGDVIDDFSAYQSLKEAGQASYECVESALAEGVAAGRLVDVPLERLAGIVWAGVHGVASLLLNHRQGLTNTESGAMRAVARLEESPRAALELLYRGVLRSSA